MTRRCLLWLLAPLLFVQHGFAQEVQITSVTGKDGKYAYTSVPGDPLKARYYQLENGLTVIISVNKKEPRIQTLIAVKAGSKNDPATNTGLAHYLEHMLFKGTDRYGSLDWGAEKKELDVIEDLYDQYNHTTDPAARKRIYRMIDSVSGIAARYAIANEYDKMVGSIGATRTNAFTSFEQTVYMNDIPSNQLNKWLMIEGERFRNPVFRLFHTELEAVYEEKNISLDDDGSKVFETLLGDLFPNHPYGTQTTIGTVEHLKNPSLREIRKYYNAYYVPNNMAVILAGDLDPAAAVRLVDKYMGGMKSAPVPPFSFRAEGRREGPREHHIYGPEAESVEIGFRTAGAGTGQAMMLELTDLLLAYKGAGLLDLNLNKKQLVQSASCSPMVNKDYSVHLFTGTPKEGQSLEEVKDYMLGEIEKLKRGEFDETAIQACVRNLKVDQMRSYENNGGRAFSLLGTFVTGTNPDAEVTKFDRMAKVTKQEIIDFATRVYADDYVIVYKHLGEAEEAVKVEKPTITPVEVNRTEQSAFVSSVLGTPAQRIQPVFIDYGKDIVHAPLGPGSEVLSVQNTQNDLFELYYVLDMGRDNDRLLPYAVTYLQYLGTDKYTAEQLSKEFFKLGCSFDVSSSRDQVYVSLSGPDESMEQGLALFEEFLANVQPDRAALDGVIASELKSRADAKLSKQAILFRGLWSYAMYGRENPFNDQLSEAELRALSPEELVEKIQRLTSFQHKVLYYGPRPMGEFAEVLHRYHRIPAALMPYPRAKEYARQSIDKNIVYFADYDMVQAEVMWLGRSEPYNPDNLPMRSMFNEYFGGGMASIVFQEIRESKALAYSTFSRYRSPDKPDEPHYILSYVGTQSDKLNEAIAGMNELHTTLPKSEQTFMASKTALKNQLETERVTGSSILFNFLDAEKFGRSEDARKVIYDNLDGITIDDVVRFHNERYTGKPFAYCVIGSRTNVDLDALREHGQVVELTLEDIFGY